MAAMQLVLLFGSTTLLAQPKYDFRNATKISGPTRGVGALYRFSNVRTGTDALVTITAITGGLVLDDLDGTSSGFQEAFQPVITVPANSKGYVEFNIVFVNTGTSTAVVQTEVPVTPIDVDGKNGNVFEFDEISRNSSSYVDYDMVGNELSVTYPSASRVQGMNIAGIDYAGVDTVAKQVMFTVMNAGISSLTVRTGGDNKSGSSQQRLRSLYFQKFIYPHSVLSQTTLPASRINNNANAEDQPLKVFPAAIRSMVTVKVKAAKSGTATFKLIDYSGRTIKQQPLPVQQGGNSIVINNLDNVIPGNYIILVSIGDVQTNQKVIKL
ncbi:hypothetical protein A4H97_08900 [Niastella yeongjuensis]|uniref:Secretion system C-terminal sorting domain-containing protein n=2 Tax=Niastella yeongjuensis TaxID=354355 RepID=A0A1V9EEU9_9BACT|nr:hypothetical protein A4H97_08900 [Niastella yeongjuensis]